MRVNDSDRKTSLSLKKMSESGDDERRPGQQGRRRGAGFNASGSNEKELASQQVQIQSKRFYIDVKENQRGRFIKLAEVGVGGRKSRIVLSIAAAYDLKQFLGEFSDLNAQMGPTQPTQQPNGDLKRGEQDAGLIKSETITKDRKRYYLDFKENQRGRFLRISMVVQRGPRAFIAIPAQGLIEFKDHLSDMLDRYGVGFEQEQPQPDLPESKSVKADNKIFYFDSGSNARGVFLKISEVRQSRYRTSITIPQAHLAEVRDQINEFLNKLPENSNAPQTSQ